MMNEDLQIPNKFQGSLAKYATQPIVIFPCPHIGKNASGEQQRNNQPFIQKSVKKIQDQNSPRRIFLSSNPKRHNACAKRDDFKSKAAPPYFYLSVGTALFDLFTAPQLPHTQQIQTQTYTHLPA